MDRALQDLHSAMVGLPLHPAAVRGQRSRQALPAVHGEFSIASPDKGGSSASRLSLAEVALKYAMDELGKVTRTPRLLQTSAPRTERLTAATTAELVVDSGDADVCEYDLADVRQRLRVTDATCSRHEVSARPSRTTSRSPGGNRPREPVVTARASSTPSATSTPSRGPRGCHSSAKRCSCSTCGGCRGCQQCRQARRKNREAEESKCRPLESHISVFPLPGAASSERLWKIDDKAALAVDIAAFPPPAPSYTQLQRAIVAASSRPCDGKSQPSAAAVALATDVASVTADVEALIEIASQAASSCPECASLAERLCRAATRELALLQESASVAELDTGRLEQLRNAVAEGLRALEVALGDVTKRSGEGDNAAPDFYHRTPSTGSTRFADHSLSPGFSSTPSATGVLRDVRSEYSFSDPRDVLADVAADMRRAIDQIRLNKQRRASMRAGQSAALAGCSIGSGPIHGRSLVGTRFAPVDLGAAFNEVAIVATM